MKTDELVISEDYRYYVTREGKLAVLMCDLTKVPVDLPFESLKETDCLIFFHDIKGSTREHYQNGRYYEEGESDADIVGCLYFAGGYQEAKVELESGLCRKFVCCDESDVIGAVFDPKTGMASWFDPYMKPALSGHSLAKSIAESIARGDGKWMEATVQSLEQRREAVRVRIEGREEFPQYWTTNTTVDMNIAFVIRTSQQEWQIVRKDGSRTNGTFPWNANHRTRLTKEQAETLLDKKASDVDWVTQNVVPFRAKIDQIRWVNHKTGEPVEGTAGQWGCVNDVVRDLYDGFVDTDDNSRLQVRCLRKDLPVKDKTPLQSVPTNEQLFEMVANLRDQMDHLNRKFEQMMAMKQ